MVRSDPRQLTELEGTTLGFIGLKGACTPYAIRREFLVSPSPYWSGSAGAIYPLVARLEKRGFIRVADRKVVGRPAKLYCLTVSGRRAQRKWMGKPVSLHVVGVPPDPLRNRVEHFPLLTREEQQNFLDEALLGCRQHLKQLVKFAAARKEAGELLSYQVVVGSVRMMQARIDWLRGLANALGLTAAGFRKQRG